MLTSILWIGGLCALGEGPSLPQEFSLEVVGPWTVELAPASIPQGDAAAVIRQPVRLDVAPPEPIEVFNERHAGLPVFNEETGGWLKGARLNALITQECTATGLLRPDSVRVKADPSAQDPFALDTDFRLDPFWGTFGRVEGGAIAENQAVFVDYVFEPCRLDSVVLTQDGDVRLVAGEPEVGSITPPVAAGTDRAIATIWVPGGTKELTEENLYRIEFSDGNRETDETGPPAKHRSVAERLLPKTLAKLQAGQHVTIVAWGDSVTNGGGVGGAGEKWYQNLFADLLRERFPEADIEMRTAAWPGASSKMYLEAPRGSVHDFERDVLEPNPDLVTIEFVNDAYLDEAGTNAHYGAILDLLRGAGAEVVLITPHLVRPDWMRVASLKFDEDPRPYVQTLRAFAVEHDVALADASRDWCALWRQGIPYTTLLANSINHPDERGHRIFAESLIGLFP